MATLQSKQQMNQQTAEAAAENLRASGFDAFVQDWSKINPLTSSGFYVGVNGKDKRPFIWLTTYAEVGTFKLMYST